MLTRVILDEIQRDIASFSDPGTSVVVSDRGRAEWTRGREKHVAQLRQTPGGFPDVEFSDRVVSYQGFLASEAMADLRDLADSILSQVVPAKNYLAAPARSGDPIDSDAPWGLADDLILKSTSDPRELPIGATRVLFLQGNAGTGKTTVLRHVSRLQAERYIKGDSSLLYLYLDAQGKGLTQLEDVMARALQDLRARFTYHSVSTLTRRKCLVPVVDGFDELIGPSSAREALKNLAQFLAQLDREGALVASSRSAFIDYRTLHERTSEIAQAQGLDYEILPITVVPWTDKEIFHYVDSLDPGGRDLRSSIKDLLGSEAGDLVRKPFFLVHVASIILGGEPIERGEDLVRQVVGAALGREANKLSNRLREPLLTAEQHREFCEILAEEMWFQQSAELDTETIRVTAEICGEQFGLKGPDAKTFVDRSIAHGLLATVKGSEKREFEHELLRFEFQAARLARSLDGNDEALKDFLLRGDLPDDVVSRVPVHRRITGGEIGRAMNVLSNLAARSKSSSIASSNGGALAAALVRDRTDVPRLNMDSLYFRGASFGSCRLEHAKITNCILEQCDLSLATLHHCDLAGTALVACRLGPGTKLAGTEIEPDAVMGLVLQTGEAFEEIYDRARILQVLATAGAKVDLGEQEEPPSVEAMKRIELVEKLLKHARGHYYLSDTDTWVQRNLLPNPAWRDVETLMRKHRLLEEVSLTKSGRPEDFMRLTMPPDLIWRARSSGGSELSAANAFWRELAA